MQKNTDHIIVFVFVMVIVLAALCLFIILMLLLYKQRQQYLLQHLDQLKYDHERNILNTRLEIQEQTFQNISREIHDNISLSLTLAKLNLHTLHLPNPLAMPDRIMTCIELLSKSISDLSNISRTLNADIVIQHGLNKAIEDEMKTIRETGLFQVKYHLTGLPVFLDSQKELIIFRIIQEAFNNIIKHAMATQTELAMHYDPEHLYIAISDNGKGFLPASKTNDTRAGLQNMRNRISMLNGSFRIISQPGQGTTLSLAIPLLP